MGIQIRTATVALGLLATTAAFANIYSNKSTDTRLPALNPSAISDSGIGAPVGGFWCEVENDLGNTLESNTNAGQSCREITVGSLDFFRLADDFTVAGGVMVVTAVKGYAYRSGAASSTSPFDSGNAAILSADPLSSPTVLGAGNAFTQSYAVPVSASGATVTTANVYRCFNTLVPAPGTAPGVTRHIQECRIGLNSPVTLGPGTYWVDYQMNHPLPSTVPVGFAPNTTHDESRTAPGVSNAMQKTTAGIGTGWIAAIDAGNPATAPDVAMDHVFILEGHVIRWAAAFNITQGTPFGGNLASLRQSDDDSVFILCDESSPNSEITFGFDTTISHTNTMEIRIESGSDRNDQVQFFAIRNPNTSAWVPIGSQPTSTTDVVFNATVNSAQTFVGTNGGVLVRAQVVPSADIEAADGWANRYDQFLARCNP